MKQLALLLVVCWLESTALGRDWYVSPHGSGNGTLAKPGSLLTACAHRGWARSIAPGDTIWLRGGTYTNPEFQVTNWWDFRVTFSGTPRKFVTWRSYSNEWAVLAGSWDFGVHRCHRFRDLQMCDPHKSTHIFDPGYDLYIRQDGPIIHFKAHGPAGGGFEFINCVLHDIRSSGIIGAVYRGCICWYVGQNGYEHSAYSSSRAMLGNIFGWNWGRVQNFALDNGVMNSNIAWNALGGFFAVNGTTTTLVGNRIYSQKQVQYVSGIDAINAVSTTVSNNTFAVAMAPLLFGHTTNLVLRDNTVVQMDDTAAYPVLTVNPGDSIGTWTVDYNRYYAYGSQPVRFAEVIGGADLRRTFPEWRALHPGFDAHSTAAEASLPPDEVHIIPNLDQPKRAHLAVYNWSRQDTVKVNVGGVLANGDSYRLWSAQDFNAGPIQTGIVCNASITVPMTNLSVAPILYGTNGPVPAGLHPEFGAFLIIGPASPENPYPAGGPVLDSAASPSAKPSRGGK